MVVVCEHSARAVVNVEGECKVVGPERVGVAEMAQERLAIEGVESYQNAESRELFDKWPEWTREAL